MQPIRQSIISTLICSLISMSVNSNSYAANCNAIANVNQYESNDSWIAKTKITAENFIVAAIAPEGGSPGSVMASPSRGDPSHPVSQNYFYHWKRDSALTMKEVFYLAMGAKAKGDVNKMNKYFGLLSDYASFSRGLQLTPNLSSDIDHNGVRNVDGRGVGDPKFNMNGTAYWGEWMRPQNDGPALEALTLMLYARALIADGKMDQVLKTLYNPTLPANTVIKVNLEATAKYWSEQSGNVWEDKKGDHFFTRLAQWKAMKEGADFARLMNDPFAADHYSQIAATIQPTLNQFFNPADGYIHATVNQTSGIDKGASLDAEILFAVIHSAELGQPFSILDDRVMATLLKLEQSFMPIYAINKIKTSAAGEPLGTAIGRNQEDKYNGYTTDATSLGNPWFISTLGMAEAYYQFRNALNIVGNITVSPLNVNFLNAIGMSKHLTPGMVIKKGSVQWSDLVVSAKQKGDGFIQRSKFHSAADGHFSEQFNRDTGTEEGVADLTWSNDAFLSLDRSMTFSLADLATRLGLTHLY